jgi:hypothetical protein
MAAPRWLHPGGDQEGNHAQDEHKTHKAFDHYFTMELDDLRSIYGTRARTECAPSLGVSGEKS